MGGEGRSRERMKCGIDYKENNMNTDKEKEVLYFGYKLAPVFEILPIAEIKRLKGKTH
jgi:hypothetical protein